MMKRTANIIGYIAAVAMMVAAVLKIAHLPGAAPALCISGLMLGIYFPVYIIDKVYSTGAMVLPVHIALALSVFIIDFGVTFRLWYLPGSAILLTLGLLGFSLVCVPMLWMQQIRKANAYKAMYTAGALGLIAWAIGLWLKLQFYPGSPVLLIAGITLLFAFYFPLYLRHPGTSTAQKKIYLRESFFVIIIGTLLTLYFIKSIEIHDMSNNASHPVQSPANTTVE
jgi:hypothetical protein